MVAVLTFVPGILAVLQWEALKTFRSKAFGVVCVFSIALVVWCAARVRRALSESFSWLALAAIVTVVTIATGSGIAAFAARQAPTNIVANDLHITFPSEGSAVKGCIPVKVTGLVPNQGGVIADLCPVLSGW